MNGWKVDRHIPVAVILAIILQTIGVVWWNAKLDSRVEALEVNDRARANDGDRLIRIEEQLKYLPDTIIAKLKNKDK